MVEDAVRSCVSGVALFFLRVGDRHLKLSLSNLENTGMLFLTKLGHLQVSISSAGPANSGKEMLFLPSSGMK